jgi:hypothetical protein
MEEPGVSSLVSVSLAPRADAKQEPAATAPRIAEEEQVPALAAG